MGEIVKDRFEFLKTVGPLARFDPAQIRRIAESCRSSVYRLGDTVVSAGEKVSGLHVVRSGKVRLFREEGGKERRIDARGPGETFGELSLVRDLPMEHTVRASAETEILLVPQQEMDRLLSLNQEARDHFLRHAAVAACADLLVPLFDLRKGFTGSEVRDLIETVSLRRIGPGEPVYAQGDLRDRNLYVVRRGELRLFMDDGPPDRPVRTLGPGEILGEETAAAGEPKRFTAAARGEAVVVAIPPSTLRTILERIPSVRTALENRARALETAADQSRSRGRSDPPEAAVDPGPRGRAGGSVLRSFPLVRQSERADCAAACLAMVCKHHRIPVSTVKLNEMVKVSPQGATLEGLARAGESLGFDAKGIRSTYPTLRTLTLPFIVHWQGYHFAVVYGIAGSRVWMADPAEGFKRISRAEFDRGWTGHCVTFEPTAGISRDGSRPSPWRRFFRYLIPFKRTLIDLLFAAFIIQVLGLAPPLIIQNILDRVIVFDSPDLLNLMIIGLALAMLFRQTAGFLSTYLMNFMVRKLDFGMIANFHRHVLSLPVSFFARRNTGDIMARFQENATIRRFMTQGSIGTVLNTLMLFTYVTLMFCYNVRLTLLLLAFLPPIILVTLAATPKYKDYARRIFYAGAEAQSRLVEGLAGAEVVKGMGAERAVRLKWEKAYARSMNIRYRAEIFTAVVGTVSGLLRAAAFVVLLWVGSRMVLAQELTIGQLMAFNALVGSIMAPVMGLVAIWDELQEALVSMERLGDVLDLDPEQPEAAAPSRIILPAVKGEIRLKNVYFRYGGPGGDPILKNLDLTIPAGSTVAVVGRSGSGKTTLARLLVGFHRPTEGKILVDDHDLSLVDLAAYRSRIGYVLQNGTLFSGTISENIAFGQEAPDPRRVLEAARIADADPFIRNLPAGYEQVVGERGMGLSGGQIQRIAIARAIYPDPGLLILDEATAALDRASEVRIHANLKRAFPDRTLILIGHRLDTLRTVDRILVLYDGAVAEWGTHEELVARRGVYYSLLNGYETYSLTA